MAELRAALEAKGVDPNLAGEVENDSLDAEVNPVNEAYVGENSQTCRPYTSTTRLLEAREAAAKEKKRKELLQAHGGRPPRK